MLEQEDHFIGKENEEAMRVAYRTIQEQAKRLTLFSYSFGNMVNEEVLIKSEKHNIRKLFNKFEELRQKRDKDGRVWTFANRFQADGYSEFIQFFADGGTLKQYETIHKL